MRKQILALIALFLVGILVLGCARGVREAAGEPEEGVAQEVPAINDTVNETAITPAETPTEPTEGEAEPTESPTAPTGGAGGIY